MWTAIYPIETRRLTKKKGTAPVERALPLKDYPQVGE